MKLINKTIGEVADVIAGQSPPSNLYNKTGNGLPFYQGKTDFGEKYPEAKTWCIGAKNKEAIKNDILLSVRAPVGPVNICQVRSVIGRGLSAIRAKKGNSFEYLFYYLKNHEQDIAKLGTGSTFKAITQTHINRIQLPIPESFDDQIRIATVLTRAERLIAKRKEIIKALDALLKSTFLEMFGDPVRNEKGFDYRSLKEFYINFKNGTKCGPFGSALKKDEYADSGIPVWNMDNISNDGRMNPKVNLWITREKYQELIGYEAQNGDVVISRAGTVGKMCVLQTEHEHSIISTNLIRVRFGNDLLPVYFVSLMNYFKGRIGKLRTGSDGAFTHMNTGVLDEMTFPYPPIELQSRFAAIIEKVESIKAKLTQSLAELENLYASLSQRAFKGELDLSRVPIVYVEAEPLETKNTISADAGNV